MKPVRFSNLKAMALSPMHYKAAEARADDAPPHTTSMRIGSAAHTMILSAGQKIAVFTGATRRGKAWEAFRDDPANAGKLIVNQTEFDKARAVADAVLRDPVASALLARAPHREQLLEWELAGRACRGTPDAFGDDIILDVKTTKTAHPDRFAWEARRMAYHAQLDWYDEGLRAQKHGVGPRQRFIIAVENSGVPAVTCFEVTPELSEQGRTMWSAWFERFCVCADSNHWPAYSETIEKLDVPMEEDMGFDLPTEEITDEGSEDE